MENKTFTIQVKRWDGNSTGNLKYGEIAYCTDGEKQGNLYIGTSKNDTGVDINTLQPFAKVGMLDDKNGDVITMINNAIANKQNKITSGTSIPSSTGNDGDVYIQYN